MKEHKVADERFKVICFYQDDSRADETVVTGLTLKQAGDICKRNETQSKGWFWGFEHDCWIGELNGNTD